MLVSDNERWRLTGLLVPKNSSGWRAVRISDFFLGIRALDNNIYFGSDSGCQKIPKSERDFFFWYGRIPEMDMNLFSGFFKSSYPIQINRRPSKVHRFWGRGGQIGFPFRLFGFWFGLQSVRVGESNPIGLKLLTQIEPKSNPIEIFGSGS